MKQKNRFKEAITRGEVQIGLWLSTASSYIAEMAATCDYDWLLIDGEHAPNNVQTLLAQLQAVAPYPAHPVVRPLEGDKALLKQVLDIGAQTVLVPMVDTADDARRMVDALRYPPHGVRGVGASIARASRWSRVPNYMAQAEENLCLLVQVESRKALENLDEIIDVEGVDGVFIGPADLSASLGHPDDAGHPEVTAIIERTIRRIREKGKAPGILAVDPVMARKCVEWGATFVAVAVDTMLFIDAMDNALATYKNLSGTTGKKNSY